MSASTNRRFMEQVVVWPGDVNAPGWINLHTHSRNSRPDKNNGKDYIVGWPYKTLDDFMSRAMWIDQTHALYDVWYCTSQQLEAGVGRTGKTKAIRLARNARSLKAIWVDCDVKPAEDDPEDRHYHSFADAWHALCDFRVHVGLPRPSAAINSGGGLHVYWISHAPLDVAEWTPYAEGLKALLLREGLKCDAGLTTDAARLLRVPGTLNHKYKPPRPVTVVDLTTPYIFHEKLAFLKQFTPVRTSIAVAPAEPLFDPAEFTAPSAAFAGLIAAENGALGKSGDCGPKLIDPTPVFEQCGFLKTALDTGGATYDNPLWNLSVLCTAFMEGGNELAHKLSSGHKSYTAADTQALYDRKMADRVDRGIGYPSCSAIAGAGCKDCATCPLFAKGKSPLNVRPIFTAAVTTQSPTAQALMLPDEYELDGVSRICYVKQEKLKDGNTNTRMLPLFFTKIDMPRVLKDPNAIQFRASLDKGNTIYTSVRQDDWCGPGYEKKLAAANVKYVPVNKSHLEQFFMAWMDKMHNTAVASVAQAFGWYREHGAIRGFAYGGLVHMDDGTTKQAGLIERTLQERFSPTGEAQPWFDAVSYITRQERPELDAIVAASFAAPLTEMTGVNGCLFSPWSPLSGIGKSFALEIGLAVWGDPRKSKETTASSAKSLEKRLMSTANLPVYWDEITDGNAQKNLHELNMLITSGTSGSKLKHTREFEQKGTWSTLIITTSNLCFKEFVAKHQPTHAAGLNRVFEYEIKPATQQVGRVPAYVANRALATLQQNFGAVGLLYASVLGKDHARIEARVLQVMQELEEEVKPREDDRFWTGIMAAIVVGAEIANELNVGFNVPALREFLIKAYFDNTWQRQTSGVATQNVLYADDLLMQFLKSHVNSSIWCERAAGSAPGRKPPTEYRRFMPNAPLPGFFHVRYDKSGPREDSITGEIMFSEIKFKEWLADPKGGGGMSFTTALQRMSERYTMRKERRTLTAGCSDLPKLQEQVQIIRADTDELKALLNLGINNSDLGASAGIAAQAEDTGIPTADDLGLPKALLENPDYVAPTEDD